MVYILVGRKHIDLIIVEQCARQAFQSCDIASDLIRIDWELRFLQIKMLTGSKLIERNK